MNTWLRACWIALVLAVVGCGGGQKAETSSTTPAATNKPGEPDALPAALQKRYGPVRPAEAPQELLAVFVLPQPDKNLASIAELANAVQEGAGAAVQPGVVAQVLAETVGAARPLGGIDFTRPIHLLVVSAGGELVRVAVVGVSKEEELTASLEGSEGLRSRVHQGFAAIGLGEGVDLVSDYALSKLQEESKPERPTVTVTMSAVATQLAPLVGMLRQALTTGPASRAADIVDAVLKGTDKVVIGLDTGKAGVTVSIEVKARQDSGMARFFGQQKPSEFGMLSRLAGTRWQMAVAGHVELSGVRQAVAEIGLAGADEKAPRDVLTGAMQAMLDGMNGEFAASGRMNQGKLFMQMLFGMRDTNQARTLARQWLELTQKHFKDPAVSDVRAPAYKHRGVPVDEYKVKTTAEGVPNAQAIPTSVAVFNNTYAMVSGDNARPDMKALIDQAQRKGAKLDPAVASSVAQATAAKDSILLLIDLAELAKGATDKKVEPGASAAVGVAFAGDSMRIRMAASASSIKAIAR